MFYRVHSQTDTQILLQCIKDMEEQKQQVEKQKQQLQEQLKQLSKKYETDTKRPLERFEEEKEKVKQLSDANKQFAEPKACDDMESKAYDALKRIFTPGQVKRLLDPHITRIRWSLESFLTFKLFLCPRRLRRKLNLSSKHAIGSFQGHQIVSTLEYLISFK